MNVVTHACAPVLAALTVDAVRLRRGRNRLFSKKHLIAIGLAGALPDLLNPHLSLNARYSSWTHTLWFLLAMYFVFGIICRTWFRPRWLLLTHWLWLATVAHLGTDMIANGIRPFYPYGPVISFRIIPGLWYWFVSDLVLVTAAFLLAFWIRRRERHNLAQTPDKMRRAYNWLPAVAFVLVVWLGWMPVARLAHLSFRTDPAAKLLARRLTQGNVKIKSGMHGVEDVSSLIEPVRAKLMLPSLAAVILKSGQVIAEGVCGVRRAGGTEAATLEDRYSMGSDTMAMTATLAAVLVEEGTLDWKTTVGEVFGKSIEGMDTGWKEVTLEEILTHRAGVSGSLDSAGLIWRILMGRGTPMQQRLQLAETVFKHPPEHAPGSTSIYSIAGYSIAGAMMENAAGRSWEELIQAKVFLPLGITSAGFGMPGKTDSDQPLGHDEDGTPIESGLQADLPATLGPAAAVHMSVRDWAKFVLAHLRGDSGNPKRECILINADSYDRLHTPVGTYAMGWSTANDSWAKGTGAADHGAMLVHNGSNWMWHCCAWLAPERDFAVLVAANQGGSAAGQGVFEVASAMIGKYLK